MIILFILIEIILLFDLNIFDYHQLVSFILFMDSSTRLLDNLHIFLPKFRCNRTLRFIVVTVSYISLKESSSRQRKCHRSR